MIAMTKEDKPPKGSAVERHDPYKMRSIEWLLSLFDGGNFVAELMRKHKELQQDLLDHLAEHGTKGCEGKMTIEVAYALGRAGDVKMGATATFKPPKKPPSSATAFINDQGELSLYSPMMARMHGAPRDVTDFDPETGEIRSVD